MNLKTEKGQLEIVKQNVWDIRHIKNPSEQVQLEAVRQDPENFRYIKNPTKLVTDFYNVLIGEEIK